MITFLGNPYPIKKHPRGFLHTAKDSDVIKADLLSLLLTNPGERVMLPLFGTPLDEIIFEPNDFETSERVREMIINSIKMWEPRVVIQNLEINITNDPNSIESSLDLEDTQEDLPHILMIRIEFSDFKNISKINELKLEIPLGG
jgi:uncharacterized protein